MNTSTTKRQAKAKAKAKAKPYRYIPRGALVPIDRTVWMDYQRRGTLRLKKSAFIASLAAMA